MGNVYKKSLISVWKPSDADANGFLHIRHTEYKQYIEPFGEKDLFKKMEFLFKIDSERAEVARYNTHILL